jgi:hypothetical protein
MESQPSGHAQSPKSPKLTEYRRRREKLQKAAEFELKVKKGELVERKAVREILNERGRPQRDQRLSRGRA